MQALHEGPTGLLNLWFQHLPLLGAHAFPLLEPVSPCLPVSLSVLIKGFKESSLMYFSSAFPDFCHQLTSFAPPLKFLPGFLLKAVKFVSIIYFGKVHQRNLVLESQTRNLHLQLFSTKSFFFLFLKTTEFLLLIIIFGYFIALKSVCAFCQSTVAKLRTWIQAIKQNT